MYKNRVIFLLGAGYGSRLKPYTDYLPKPLFPVYKKSLIAYHLNELELLPAPIFINVAYHPNAMITYLSSLQENLKFIYEVEPIGVLPSLKQLVFLDSSIDQVLLISSDLYLKSYDEIFAAWRVEKPHVFINEQYDYAGVSIIDAADLRQTQAKDFKNFFMFMQDSYSSSVLGTRVYNVGRLAEAPK